MKEKILRFVLTKDEGVDIHSRFFPGRQMVLNRTEWRGKEPRSCAVTRLWGEVPHPGHMFPVRMHIEVTYRPNGCISYVDETRYDGWTPSPLDQQNDGTLLDGNGNELKDGQPPAELENEVRKNVDFNELDFGEFMGEFEAEGIKHVAHDDVMQEFTNAGKLSCGGLIAPRLSRIWTKIILTDEPPFARRNEFGTKVINICKDTPHLDHVLLEALTGIMKDYLEGRAMVKSVGPQNPFGTPTSVFVELSNSVVYRRNEHGLGSWFDVLTMYTPADFLDELAQRLMAIYDIGISVVDGAERGLLLKRTLKQ